jgi:hypothetical protein
MLSVACKDRRELQDNQQCDQHLKYMPPKYRLNFEFDFVTGGSVIFLLLLIIIIAVTPFGAHDEVTHFPGVDEHFKIAYTSCGRVEG